MGPIAPAGAAFGLSELERLLCTATPMPAAAASTAPTTSSFFLRASLASWATRAAGTQVVAVGVDECGFVAGCAAVAGGLLHAGVPFDGVQGDVEAAGAFE
ncbi:hypothetical protein GCM10010442_77910 [Kitasatospora kifunensis]